MKFSYSLVKKLAPSVKSRDDLIAKLSAHVFEAERGDGPDTVEVDVFSNRYSSAASHRGLAREILAVYGETFREPKVKNVRPAAFPDLKVEVKTPRLCRRLIGWRFSEVKISNSPAWIKKALVSCGLRPINNLVDITNCVMLETGQPVHVFDMNKMASEKLIVRLASSGEKVETLDGVLVKLDSDTLVLADENDPLDLAGIKGGKKAEVTRGTKNILLTAGNFDGASIYKTSRRTGVVTDASNRFAHNLSPELAEIGACRAAELIVGVCEARSGKKVDVYPIKPRPITLAFDIKKFEALVGFSMSKIKALAVLKRLGFGVRGKTVSVPILRDDVMTHADLVEEVVRIYGYDRVPSRPPKVSLAAPETDEVVLLKERAREFLTGVGFDEVYNYSFISAEEAEEGNFWQYKPAALKNFMSRGHTHLRPTLQCRLIQNAEDNLKRFPGVRIFEIGNVFGGLTEQPSKVIESLHLGLAVGGEENKTGENFFELKGAVETFLKGLGITDYNFSPSELLGNGALVVEADSKVIGYVARKEKTAVSELNLNTLLQAAREENEFQPLPKFPATQRDLSILVDAEIRIGDVMEEIELADALIKDVDLIDEYRSGNLGERQSITFRLVFQADDRTLTGEEVDRIVMGIVNRLGKKFGAEAR